MKNTLKLSIFALSVLFMTTVSSCDKPKPTVEAVDTNTTVIVPAPDTTATVKMDTAKTTTELKKDEKVK